MEENPDCPEYGERTLAEIPTWGANHGGAHTLPGGESSWVPASYRIFRKETKRIQGIMLHTTTATPFLLVKHT
jgi:hypothetical protein